MFAEMPLDNLDGNQIRGLGRHLGLPAARNIAAGETT
jgi:hypothetical protein